MGYTSYNLSDRSMRASNLGYHTKSVNDIFQQNVLSKIHESLNPKDLRVRECLDSAAHPNSLGVVFGLDVTGSMGKIPHMLIKDGLPTMMGLITEKGSPDAAVCFAAVGDHLNDRAPLQIAQFESGDAELDTHLQNTWLEGNGGGNGGESYPLAWYFAANHTKLDCLDKRNQKGVLITVGDEDFHKDYSVASLKHIFGSTCRIENDTTAADLLEAAKKKFHVYHLGLTQTTHNMSGWREILGNNFISVPDYTEIPKLVADIVLKHTVEYKNQGLISQGGDAAQFAQTTMNKSKDDEALIL